MKYAFFIAVLSFALTGCTNSEPAAIADKPSEQNTNQTAPGNQPETVAAHTLEKSAEQTLPKSEAEKTEMIKKSDKKTGWTRSGDPIDTSKFDAEIAQAEKNFKAKPNDAAAEKNLSEAFTKRGVALTEARQYAAAIGDYRKALKYNARNEEAKKWIATITNIYKSMNREVPPPGEEPEPLEFNQ